MLQSHGDANVTVRNLAICVFLAFLVQGCRLSLGLDIMNAGKEAVQVTLGSKTEKVVPGLSFHGIFPAPQDSKEVVVTSASCQYKYALPDLNSEPWKSLIGKSIKFRWFDDGRMVAYPPTPDVEIRDNPQRASEDATLSIQPIKASCR
jgi:hypothetical protein